MWSTISCWGLKELAIPIPDAADVPPTAVACDEPAVTFVFAFAWTFEAPPPVDRDGSELDEDEAALLCRWDELSTNVKPSKVSSFDVTLWPSC